MDFFASMILFPLLAFTVGIWIGWIWGFADKMGASDKRIAKENKAIAQEEIDRGTARINELELENEQLKKDSRDERGAFDAYQEARSKLLRGDPSEQVLL